MPKIKTNTTQKENNTLSKLNKEEISLDLENFDEKKKLVKFRLEPEARALDTLVTISKTSAKLDIFCLISALKENSEQVVKGDMQLIETMLITQAQTLDAIFNNMAVRSYNSEYLKPMDHKMRLALKAQSQCRATLETLANIKNPPHLAFVKQQNVAYQQQVNNGISEPSSKTVDHQDQASLSHARGEKNNFSPNKLLIEENSINVTHLDTRAKDRTGKADPQLETLAEVHRP